MIDDLELELQNSINEYKDNPSEDKKNSLIGKITDIDKSYNDKYLEELKLLVDTCSTLECEQERLRKIVTILSKRKQDRDILLRVIDELSLDLTLKDIPNVEKLKVFSNRLKLIEVIIEIRDNLNTSNRERAIEILSEKEFKMILLEFSLINNDSDDEVEKYIDSILVGSKSSSGKLKILEYYDENKSDFPDLDIPNMGLVSSSAIIDLDSKDFFIDNGK